MTISKKYLNDKVVLLFVSINVFLTLLTIILIALRLGSGHASYIVQYRANLGINAFKSGSVTGLLAFMLFALVVLATHVGLSIKTYHIHRQLSVTVLALGILLLSVAIIVSNALLVLR